MRTYAAPLLAIVFAACAGAPARATPLTATAAVQTKPDPAAPIITYLKAGAEPTPTAQAAEPLPPGWIAVDVPGPLKGYVRNSDFTKDLDVLPGASIYLAPKADSGILHTAAKGDKAEIIGLFGDWTQVRLDGPVVGYVQANPAASATPSEKPAEPAAPATTGPSAASASVPIAPAAPSAPASQPAQETVPRSPSLGSVSNGALPRYLEGKVMSTHRLFLPRRPYEWELVDPSGRRIAYLDLSRLVLTEQFADYAGREVLVFGPVRATPDGKSLVVEIETLELR